MKIIKVLFLILLLSFPTFAGGGSYYSRFGLGDVYFGTSARTLGMGGLGIAQADNFINTLNPAGWNRIKYTSFETGIRYTKQNLKDKTTSSSFNDFKFMGFLIGLPLEKDLGLSLVGGIQPVSNIQYDISTLMNNGSEAYFQGKGGLTKAILGLSYRLPLDVAIGASFEYYTGENNYTSGLSFPNDANSYGSEYMTKLQFTGVGWNFGVISSDLNTYLNLGFIEDMRLGLNFNLIGKLNTDSLITSKSILSTSSYVQDTVSENSVFTDMPKRFGIGLSIKADKNYTFVFDYLVQYWSDLKIGGKKAIGLRNLNKYSVGFEYNRNASQFSSFWEQIVFRGGLSLENTQYRINNEDIKQFSINGGLSLPLGFGSSIDIGLQYGYRGTTDFGLLKENFFKADFSLSFGEIWFLRQDR